MIYILIATVLALFGVILFLAIGLRKTKAQHDEKVEMLQQMIVQLLSNQDIQNSKLKLSDELKERLEAANRTISHDILAVAHEVIETLSQNDLLKK